MKYILDNKEYEVFVVKKNNKNTYIRVKDNKTIYITTNYFVTKKYIYDLLDKNKEFLRKALKKVDAKSERLEKFLLLGNEYNVEYNSNISSVMIDYQKRYIYSRDAAMLNKWLLNQIKDLFLKRLDYNYYLFKEKIPYPKLKIRLMKTRWGVCNRRSTTVTLNSKLIEYDIEKLDYVIIHELSHFIHFNHSKLFWETVSKYCTDYKRIRKELKD